MFQCNTFCRAYATVRLFCPFRLYSLVSNFWTKSNTRQVMKLQHISVLNSRYTHVFWQFLFPFLVTYSIVISHLLIGSFTAVSGSDPDTSLSPVNENLPDTSSACPSMDYTPFIRCSAALTLILFCHLIFHYSFMLQWWFEQAKAVTP